MSIATEIQKLQTNLSNSYASCSSKGATLPTNQNFDNLASTIDSISGGGGGGATITAVNKTGSAISAGQKVWLNDGGQVQGSSYQMYGSSGTSTYYQAYQNIIDQTGLYGNRSPNLYALTNTQANLIQSTTSGYGCSNYYFYDGDKEALLIMTDISYAQNLRNIYAGNIWQMSGGTVIPGYKSNYCTGSNSLIKTFDYETGETTNAYTLTKTLENYRGATLIYLDKYKTIYSFTGRQSAYYQITAEGLIEGSLSISSYYYPIGCTQDCKYIICVGNPMPTSRFSTTLTLLKVDDQLDIKELTQTQMPADLQDYYAGSNSIVFNAKTQILTCTKTNSSDYVVMQYSGGSWTKLNIDLSTELASYPYWRGGLFLSDDLSRASLNVGTVSNGAYYGRIVNLTAQTGYIAQNYATYNVNSDTITGYATEDAAADASFTANIASQNSGGGGSNPGEEITAINKTSRVINEGDKVWVNQHSQVAGSNFNLEVNSNNGNVFIDLTGTWAWSNNKYFTLTDSSGTQIGTTNISGASVSNLRYGPQNSIFFESWRLDPEAIYHLSYTYIGGNYMLRSSGLTMKIESFDLATGNIIETYDWDLSNSQRNTALVVYNYGENNTPSVYMWGQSPDTTCYRYYIETGSFSRYTTNGTMKPIAVTPDNKYLIGYTVSSNYLRMADISTNNGKPVILSQLQMPEDLQPYYSEKECKMCFNPHNNILSIAGINNSNYVVMKYNNGEWTKLNVEIPAPLQFCTLLTFSNDLSRCCFANYEDTHFKVINLTSYEEYIAQDYSAYVNNEQTITGVALETVQPDETLSIGTVVPK